MRRDPAGTAATDFNGSGEPEENGRTKISNVPRVGLPVQPGGMVAAASAAASKLDPRIRTTILRRVDVNKSRRGTTLHIFAFRLSTTLVHSHEYQFRIEVPILFRQDSVFGW